MPEKITVYGPGCAKCKLTEKVVREAVAESGAAVEVEKVTEIREMVKAGVMTTPAVAVDGVLKVAGKVPKPEEVRAWLAG
jgi:small redox-active disulfide protein 2